MANSIHTMQERIIPMTLSTFWPIYKPLANLAFIQRTMEGICFLYLVITLRTLFTSPHIHRLYNVLCTHSYCTFCVIFKKIVDNIMATSLKCFCSGSVRLTLRVTMYSTKVGHGSLASIHFFNSGLGEVQPKLLVIMC